MSVPVGTYGVTPAGWVSKPTSTNESEIDAGLQTILGTSAGTEPDGSIPLRSKAGQLKVLMTDRDQKLWNLGAAIYASFNPKSAGGPQLDSICSLTGTIREGLQFASVTAFALGTSGTVLAIGRQASVVGTGTVYASTFATTIEDSPETWTASTAYVVGSIVYNSGAMYYCTGGGTSAGSGGPSGLGTDIADGTATWCWLGAATTGVTCYATLTFEAQLAGPVNALAGTLSTIVTPVNGWQSICNPVDGAPGAAVESDPALRARRDFEAASSGNATVDAIQAKLEALNQSSSDPAHIPLKSVKVLFNDTDLIDVNGLSPHSVEAIAYYGGADNPTTDQDIANAIWAVVGGGIKTNGNQTSTIVDSQGDNQTVQWSKPDPVPVYLVVAVGYDPKVWTASNAATLVENGVASAVLTFAEGYPAGRSVRVSPLSASVFDQPYQINTDNPSDIFPVIPASVNNPSLPGIVSVYPFYIGTSPSPGTGATIAIGVRQVAQFSTDNTTVTATPETP